MLAGEDRLARWRRIAAIAMMLAASQTQPATADGLAIVDVSDADFKLQTPPDMEPSDKGAANVLAQIGGSGSRNVDDYVDLAVLEGLQKDGTLAAFEQKYGKR